MVSQIGFQTLGPMRTLFRAPLIGISAFRHNQVYSLQNHKDQQRHRTGDIRAATKYMFENPTKAATHCMVGKAAWWPVAKKPFDEARLMRTTIVTSA